jgi:hypothetical protein
MKNHARTHARTCVRAHACTRLVRSSHMHAACVRHARTHAHRRRMSACASMHTRLRCESRTGVTVVGAPCVCKVRRRHAYARYVRSRLICTRPERPRVHQQRVPACVRVARCCKQRADACGSSFAPPRCAKRAEPSARAPARTVPRDHTLAAAARRPASRISARVCAVRGRARACAPLLASARGASRPECVIIHGGRDRGACWPSRVQIRRLVCCAVRAAHAAASCLVARSSCMRAASRVACAAVHRPVRPRVNGCMVYTRSRVGGDHGWLCQKG